MTGAARMAAPVVGYPTSARAGSAGRAAQRGQVGVRARDLREIGCGIEGQRAVERRLRLLQFVVEGAEAGQVVEDEPLQGRRRVGRHDASDRTLVDLPGLRQVASLDVVLGEVELL